MMAWSKMLLMVVIRPSRETGRVPPWQEFSQVEKQSFCLFKEQAQAVEHFVQHGVVLKTPLGCTGSVLTMLHASLVLLGHYVPGLVQAVSTLILPLVMACCFLNS